MLGANLSLVGGSADVVTLDGLLVSGAQILIAEPAGGGDALGRLSLTKAGLLRRDEVVLTRLRDAGVPVCVLLAGGYAPDVEDTVAINLATVRAATAAARAPAGA